MTNIKIVGHRGARGLAPENTIASLRKALDHHVDEIEFDLRVTKDKAVVLHHNRKLVDPSGGKYQINKCTYKELKSRKPDLTTLEEVLETIGHSVPLYLEVKHGVPIKPIVKIIDRYLANGWKTDYFLLGSKSQKTLLQLHAQLPDIEKIVIEPWSGIRATRRARQVNTKRLSMQQLWLWGGFIRMMARRGWQVYPYVVNNPAKARRWTKRGLAGVITDFPDRFNR